MILFVQHFNDTKEIRFSTYVRRNIEDVWYLIPINKKYNLLEDKHTSDITRVHYKEILKCVEMFVDYVYWFIIKNYSTKEDVNNFLKIMEEESNIIEDDFNMAYDKDLGRTRQLTERERLNIDIPNNLVYFYGEEETVKEIIEDARKLWQ
jgi:hypothetical protein